MLLAKAIARNIMLKALVCRRRIWLFSDRAHGPPHLG
jgi:hypothetical protein